MLGVLPEFAGERPDLEGLAGQLRLLRLAVLDDLEDGPPADFHDAGVADVGHLLRQFGLLYDHALDVYARKQVGAHRLRVLLATLHLHPSFITKIII